MRESISRESQDFFNSQLGDPPIVFIDAFRELSWPTHHRELLLPNQQHPQPGWALKLAATYLVPFQEVLFLDADSTPLIAPEELFENAEYKKSGTLFFPDAPCVRTRIFDRLIGMNLITENDAPEKEGERETESAQFLIDRRRHRIPLEFIMFLGTHAEYSFSQAHGDKDLFRAGFALAGAAKDFTLVPGGLGFAWSPPNATDPFMNRTMRGFIQYAHSGQPLFHHRTWYTKYDFGWTPNGSPLGAISGPLPCAWSTTNWPILDFVLSTSRYTFIERHKCAFTFEKFGQAMEACQPKFDGSSTQPLPIYSIKGSNFEKLHLEQERGWKYLLQYKETHPQLFSVGR